MIMNGRNGGAWSVAGVALIALAAATSTVWGAPPNAPAKRPAATKPAPVTKTAAAAPAAACNRAAFRIVIDVGHTAQSPGAASARNVNEFDFNHRLANVVVRKLTDMGFGRTVLLVTQGGAQRSLAVRVTHANATGADLFLSIHHDSVPDRMMESWEYEGRHLHYNDQYPGHSIFVSVDNPHYQESLLFATIVGKEMKARGLQYTPHYTDAIMGSRRRILVDSDAGVYRYDQLIVLRNTRMPAALLEAGSIVNRKEELLLAAPERENQIAAAVGAAVDRYCQMHPPHDAAPKDLEAHAQPPRGGHPTAKPVLVSGTNSSDQ
jgi:N-acetylmuramoyl-L-alanine amidase